MAERRQVEVHTAELTDALRRLSTIQGGRGERMLRKMLASIMKDARKIVSSDAASNINSDPRKAARAVRHMLYKKIVGGQINILNKRRAGKAVSSYRPKRTLRKNGPGGNRLARSGRTEQVDSYFGSDRGFILRFVNAGTSVRNTRYGARGRVEARNWFRSSGDRAMRKVANDFERTADEIVKELWG